MCIELLGLNYSLEEIRAKIEKQTLKNCLEISIVGNNQIAFRLDCTSDKVLNSSNCSYIKWIKEVNFFNNSALFHVDFSLLGITQVKKERVPVKIRITNVKDDLKTESYLVDVFKKAKIREGYQTKAIWDKSDNSCRFIATNGEIIVVYKDVSCLIIND